MDLELLNQAFGPFTLKEWALGLLALGIALSIYNSFMARRAGGTGPALKDAACIGCGWKGKVSKYHRTCPKCGNAITRTTR